MAWISHPARASHRTYHEPCALSRFLNVPLLITAIRRFRHVLRERITDVQHAGQVCRFEGKIGRGFEAFTRCQERPCVSNSVNQDNSGQSALLLGGRYAPFLVCAAVAAMDMAAWLRYLLAAVCKIRPNAASRSCASSSVNHRAKYSAMPLA
jgi:hypothetical protein